MTSSPQPPFPPSAAPAWLDVRKFALASDTLSGADTLPHYPRLLQDLRQDVADFDQKTVTWHARGETITPPGASPQPWLHLQVQAQLPMTCQRCLTTVDISVDLDRHFRFVADESIAMAEDDAAEEDLLVVSKQFDLHALIEDELLMALPIVPKHAVCPQPVKLASTDEEFKAALTQKPNAFAALGSLKKPT
jgi:uncharacterized protein